jgi:hypothetical protein
VLFAETKRGFGEVVAVSDDATVTAGVNVVVAGWTGAAACEVGAVAACEDAATEKANAASVDTIRERTFNVLM